MGSPGPDPPDLGPPVGALSSAGGPSLILIKTDFFEKRATFFNTFFINEKPGTFVLKKPHFNV
jgi:hypothetical protein